MVRLYACLTSPLPPLLSLRYGHSLVDCGHCSDHNLIDDVSRHGPGAGPMQRLLGHMGEMNSSGTVHQAWGLEVDVLSCNVPSHRAERATTSSHSSGVELSTRRDGGRTDSPYLSGFEIRKLLLHPRTVRGEFRPRVAGEPIPEGLAAALSRAQMDRVLKQGCGFFVLTDGSVLLDNM